MRASCKVLQPEPLLVTRHVVAQALNADFSYKVERHQGTDNLEGRELSEMLEGIRLEQERTTGRLTGGLCSQRMGGCTSERTSSRHASRASDGLLCVAAKLSTVSMAPSSIHRGRCTPPCECHRSTNEGMLGL